MISKAVTKKGIKAILYLTKVPKLLLATAIPKASVIE